MYYSYNTSVFCDRVWVLFSKRDQKSEGPTRTRGGKIAQTVSLNVSTKLHNNTFLIEFKIKMDIFWRSIIMLLI